MVEMQKSGEFIPLAVGEIRETNLRVAGLVTQKLFNFWYKLRTLFKNCGEAKPGAQDQGHLRASCQLRGGGK